MRAMSWMLLLLALPAAAGETLHTVAPGESISSIARRYYGDFSHTNLLLRFNGRHGTDLHPGERLRIPFCVDHRVARGDNGSTLAERFLGRASAWESIAELNGLIPEAPLQPGQTIAMPFILRHTIVRGDSLSSLAGTFYGDPGRGALLQAFNGITDPRELAVGEVVEVPLVGVRLSGSSEQEKPPQAIAPEEGPSEGNAPHADAATHSASPSEPPAEPATRPAPVEPLLPDWFAGDFSSAERAYLRGDYEDAAGRIDALIERIEAIPLPEERSRVWRLAAFIDVAFDRDERACAAFRSMRSTGAPVELDPSSVSPKIRKALAACESR